MPPLLEAGGGMHSDQREAKLLLPRAVGVSLTACESLVRLLLSVHIHQYPPVCEASNISLLAFGSMCGWSLAIRL